MFSMQEEDYFGRDREKNKMPLLWLKDPFQRETKDHKKSKVKVRLWN
jgi:hypothetical protein